MSQRNPGLMFFRENLKKNEQLIAHNKVNLIKKLVNLKYKERRNITKHNSEFQGLVD